MTLIVGILCDDGVVVAADGAATYGVMGQNTIRQPVKKLEILSNSVIVGVSGPVGTSQRYQGEIRRMWETKVFRNDQADQAMQRISNALAPITKAELAMAQAAAPVLGNLAVTSAMAHMVVAIPIQKESCLIQYNQQVSPELASRSLPFVAIGGGQLTADPFLAFIRRLFWPTKLPTLAEGIFAALWTLRHAIQTSPGGVADPIQVAVLEGMKARELDGAELAEHERAIADAEMRCANALTSATTGAAPDAPIQAPPTA